MVESNLTGPPLIVPYEQLKYKVNASTKHKH